jgi:beige protein homolog 1
MESPSRRHRSSTTTSRRTEVKESPVGSEVSQIVNNLFDTIKDGKRATLSTLQIQCIDLRRLRQLLIDSTDRTLAKDAFRHARGFVALLDTLHSVKEFYNSTSLPREEFVEFFELLKNTLEVLSEALFEHPGNRRYFRDRVDGNGWAALEKALADTGVGIGLSGSTGYDPGFEQFFGCLLAFAVGEETMTHIFRDIGKVASKVGISQDLPAIKEETTDDTDSSMAPAASLSVPNEAELLACLRSHIKSYFDGNEVLRNPQIVPFMFKTWARFFEIKPPSPDLLPLSTAILLVLQKVLATSAANKLAFHETGSLRIVLPILFEEDITHVEHKLLHEISEELISLGVNHLDDAYYLFNQASQQETAAELLAQGMKTSRQPAFIQFDLTQNGFSSLELADLGRTFPPQSAGYTLTFWVKVDTFDKNCHTTLFGAYDASQTCFVLAYLEKDTRNFILQTSITSSKPSIRFKSTVFQPGAWYHIALVHRRPKPGGTSKAALFVNGEFAEQQKCYYPSPPPPVMDQSESFASLTSMGQKRAPVQAFLGTPQDLASRLGKNVVSTRWSLASCHLFDEALTDELVAVHQKLGPRYNGNFQDCLGSFQTYRASAELNLYNELLHPGKEEKSQIVQAIRLNASTILPESRILLSISPLAVMDDDNNNTVDESQLIKSLSKRAAKCLHLYTLQGGNSIAINAAVPSINEALTHPYGVAVLTGNPVVVVPQSLDDASWRVAGCAAVGLKLLQLSRTPESVLRSLGILFDSVSENWRNSEAMERDNGFGVLAALLREKLGFGPVLSSTSARSPSRRGSSGVVTPNSSDFSLKSLKAVLEFVGFNDAKPEDSIIINPLAYRILLVDFDMWRNSSPETQKHYYQQLWHFAKGSKQHHFNSKRLNRMRIVKKLLDALKGETFLPDVFPSFLKAFEGLIRCSMSGETLRSVALYITFSLQDSRASYTRVLRAKSSVMRLRSKASTPNLRPGSSPVSRSRSPAQDFRSEGALTQQELGIRVLDMYAKIMCDRTSYNDIRKFAKTVTNKVCLHSLIGMI